jgi:hypothetical protein
MMDYIISEEDGMEAVRLISRNNPQTAKAFESVFHSRPLLEALKAERREALDALLPQLAIESAGQYPWFRNCYDDKTIVPIKEWGAALARIKNKIESLRSEP